ncbi:MFS transporter [Streptomyces sp. H10-C2]|uniref:MFS transporter n=1 Tax=unclassified Streptomyces TaxID=2593676 RepID=UPI0024BBA3A6|nr:MULTISPECIES: MFS transporter [unclassified Streptomyces]MDJ0346054.1 MFS transporter [Streptomyces sp. PH10-H1]MDJ0373030.1 MFS transporter [Streptomyces sp. H10-C2]
MQIPGGRDGRRMLWINLVDKTGSGLWVSVTALYFIVVADLSAGQVGLLLALAGAVGIAGSPLAGRLADRFPLTRLLLAVQIVRGASALLVLAAHGFWQLLPLVAVGSFGERSASVLTKLYAARVAGPDRSRYQAVQRTVVNVGYTVGGLGASAGIAFGSTGVYRGLLLGDALSFCVVAVLVARCTEPPSATRTVRTSAPARAAAGRPAAGRPAAGRPEAAPNPWRDRGYLAYAATDALLFLDGSVLRVGMPLWIISATTAPHGLAALLFVINTVVVVLLQVRLSRHGRTPRLAAMTLRQVAACYLLGGAAVAASVVDARWAATAALLVAAVAFTFVEMFQATVSWELSVALAPDDAQGAYVGVHGLAQATERAAGPLIMTSAVIAGGPLGWLGFGAALAATALVQKRMVLRRLGSTHSVTDRAALSEAPVTVSEQ